MNKLNLLQRELNSLKDLVRAKNSAWFFKTGKGQYGEGDSFLGITVPVQRAVAKRYKNLTLAEIKRMLQSPIHEHRFTALEILVFQFEEADKRQKEKIFKFYISNSRNINNWDLVDTSARYIVGQFLIDRPRTLLYKLAVSSNLWQRRIAIVSTSIFIARNDFSDALKISRLLLFDKHDLIHKAVGWMLREVGKRDQVVLLDFLKQNYDILPRTTLRYSIERFPYATRKNLLAGRFN